MTNKLTPIRIQHKRTKGWRMPENTVYVGRPSKWGNYVDHGVRTPFNKYAYPKTPDEKYKAVLMFNAMLTEKDKLNIRQKLKGKNLACWCPIIDKKGLYVQCHADILLKIANDL